MAWKNIFRLIHIREVGIFDIIFLSNFFWKIKELIRKEIFCSKLNLILTLVHSWFPLWPVKHYQAFLLGQPIHFWNYFILSFRKQKGTIKAFDKFYSWFPAFLDMFPDEEAFLTFAFWFVITTIAVAFVASRYIKIKPHHL